jgi:hypothetical protein
MLYASRPKFVFIPQPFAGNTIKDFAAPITPA